MRKLMFLVYILFFALQGYGNDSTDIIEIDTNSRKNIAGGTDSVVTSDNGADDSSSISPNAKAESNDSSVGIISETAIQLPDTTIAEPEPDTVIIGEKEKAKHGGATNKKLPAKTSLEIPEKKISLKKVGLLQPIIQKKRRTAIIGSALFATGVVIKYGLIVPQSYALADDDTEGQLALISPTLLSLGLKVAGSTMSCMRTSETVDSYEEYIGPDTPRNFSWFSFISGFGLMLGAQIAGGVGIMMENDNISASATGLDILQDVVWGFTNIYSIIYITKLGEKAETSRISIIPGRSRSGAPGMAVLIKF